MLGRYGISSISHPDVYLFQTVVYQEFIRGMYLVETGVY